MADCQINSIYEKHLVQERNYPATRCVVNPVGDMVISNMIERACGGHSAGEKSLDKGEEEGGIPNSGNASRNFLTWVQLREGSPRG